MPYPWGCSPFSNVGDPPSISNACRFAAEFQKDDPRPGLVQGLINYWVDAYGNMDVAGSEKWRFGAGASKLLAMYGRPNIAQLQCVQVRVCHDLAAKHNYRSLNFAAAFQQNKVQSPQFEVVHPSAEGRALAHYMSPQQREHAENYVRNYLSHFNW